MASLQTSFATVLTVAFPSRHPTLFTFGDRFSHFCAPLYCVFPGAKEPFELGAGTVRLFTEFCLALIAALLWSVALVVDPFGMSRAADDASLDAFLRAYAPLYPNVAQRSVAVISIGDDMLPLRPGGAGSWPIDFADHAAILDKIYDISTRRPPKAVFLDFHFDNPHTRDPSLPSLVTAINRLSQGRGVPVYYGVAPESVDALGRIANTDRTVVNYFGRRSVLEDSGAVARPVFVFWSGYEGRYPLFLRDGRRSTDGERSWTAAGRIYRDSLTPEAARAFDEATSRPGAEGMLVAWGVRAPSNHVQWDGAPCPKFGDRPFAQGAASVRIFFQSLFPVTAAQRARAAHIQPCSYHRQVLASDLFSSDPEVAARVRSTLRNAYVLIGGAIAGIDQHHRSPVAGTVHGVAVQAMALDNLLTFGTSYIRNSPSVRLGLGSASTEIGADIIIQFAFIFAATLAAGLLFDREARSRGAARSQLAARLFFAAAAGFICVSTAIFLFLQFQWAPLNWAGVFVAVVVAAFAGSGGSWLQAFGIKLRDTR